jgi:ferredoxin
MRTVLYCAQFVGSALFLYVPGSAFLGRSILQPPPIRPSVARWSFDTLGEEYLAAERFPGASRYTGFGPIEVDMNAYNLPVEDITHEWTAVLVPLSALRAEGVYLGAKSSKTVMVDTLQVVLPRRMGEGMGIQLLEIAGGRDDGLGITVVDGLVEGGCAEGSGINFGDSISMISLRKKQIKSSNEDDGDGGLYDLEEIETLAVECFGYDKTVEAILSLPPAESDDEVIVLTLKRLRRKPKVIVNLRYPPSQGEPDTTIELFSGENLRRAMLTRGVKLNDPLSRRFDSGGIGDCGAEGTCATCVVSITGGAELLNPAGTQEKQILVKNPRWRMACRAVVGYGMREGELTVRVNPRQWAE